MSENQIVYNEHLEAITGLLRTFNMWPKSNKPEDVNGKFYGNLLIFILPLALPGFLSYFMHLRNTLRDIDFDEILVEVVIMFEILCVFGIIDIYFYKLKEIVYLINYNSGLEEYRRVNYKKTIKIIKIVVAPLILVLACHEYLTKSTCQGRKLTSNAREVCGYLYPCHFNFDFNHSPIYEIILLHQILSISLIFCVLINICMLMIYFVEKCVAKLKSVQYILKRIDQSDLRQDKNVRDELARAVEMHNHTLTIVDDFNSVCKWENFIQFMMGSVIIALLIFDVLTSKNVESIAQLVGWITMLCLINVVCQLLTNEGENLETALYDIKWYEMNIENQKTVHLMLVEAQKPLAVEAGPFQTLQLTSLFKMYQATYSYLNLLVNTLYQRQ